jgi:hypothetical protein
LVVGTAQGDDFAVWATVAFVQRAARCATQPKRQLTKIGGDAVAGPSVLSEECEVGH